MICGLKPFELLQRSLCAVLVTLLELFDLPPHMLCALPVLFLELCEPLRPLLSPPRKLRDECPCALSQRSLCAVLVPLLELFKLPPRMLCALPVLLLELDAASEGRTLR